MKTFPLALKPCDRSQRSAKAWFIPGAQPEHWLTELRETGLPLAEFALYFMPSSISDRRPSGLFVVHSQPLKLKDHHWSAIPYGRLAQLYLPTHCQLLPPVEAEEIELELTHSLSVFHPGIGLVGFEESDQKSIHDLIAPPERRPRASWNHAKHEPALHRPRLLGVRPLLPASTVSLLESGRGDIGEKAQATPKKKDAKKKAKKTRPGRKAETAKNKEDGGESKPGWFKKAVAKGVQWISGQEADSEKTGWFHKFSDWAGRTLTPKILERRKLEIQRLMQLLDDNPDEGLRYALPLSSTGLTGGARGPVRPGSTLTSRTVDYRAPSGRGGASDPWALNHETVQKLRSKYLKAAQRELRLGRHRRAAYIFSELLGDHSNAALALKDGKHYREAAMIYKDRLNQPHQAAQCLAQGGYYRDAIEIYERIRMFEQAGDLYKKLELEKESREAYLKAASTHEKSRDYLRAGKIVDQKVGEPLGAVEIYKRAWRTKLQATKCVLAEFEIYGRLSLHSEAEKRLIEFGETPYQTQQLQNLVAAIAQISQSYPKRELKSLAADKTRVIIGMRLPHASRLEAKALIRWLNHTQPQDHLLARDSLRYQEQSKGKKTRARPKRVKKSVELKRRFQLLSGQWKAAACDDHNFYVAGILNRQVIAVRIFEDGTMLSHVWPQIPGNYDKIKGQKFLTLATSSYPSLPIILKSSAHPALRLHRFENNDLIQRSNLIGTPHWLSPETIAAAYTSSGVAWTLMKVDAELTLHCYASAGTLVASKNIRNDQELSESGHDIRRILGLALEKASETEEEIGMVFSNPEESFPFSQNGPFMESHGDQLFVAHHSKLYSFINSNLDDQIVFDHPIECLAVSPELTKAQLALGFKKGAQYIGSTDSLKKRIDFARDMIDPQLCFTRDGDIIAVSPKYGRIYQCKGAEISTKSHFEAPRDPILAVLPGVSKGTFAIITKNGQVSIYEIPQ